MMEWGSLLFGAASGHEWVDRGGREDVMPSLPADVDRSDDLAQLLLEAMRRKPGERIGVADAMVHIYFTSLERSASEAAGGEAGSSGRQDPKLEALQEFLALLRDANSSGGRMFLNIRRETVVDGVLAQFSLPNYQLLPYMDTFNQLNSPSDSLLSDYYHIWTYNPRFYSPEGPRSILTP